MVHVAVQHKRGTVSASQLADDISCLIHPNLIIPQPPHFFHNQRSHLPFLTWQARSLDQLLGKSNQVLPVCI
jgi:hypothetical protein